MLNEFPNHVNSCLLTSCMKLKTVCFYMESFQENLDHQTIPKKTLTNQIFIRPFITIYLKKIRLLQKVESSNYVRCTRAKGGGKKKWQCNGWSNEWQWWGRVGHDTEIKVVKWELVRHIKITIKRKTFRKSYPLAYQSKNCL